MTSILDQVLQAAASNDVAVSVLLRRVKIASSKLALPKIEDWVGSELNGYQSEVPDYRKMQGLLKGRVPGGPWQTILGNHDVVGILSLVPLHDPIASVESLASVSGKFHSFGFGVEQRKLLDQVFQVPNVQFRLEVPSTALVSIVDQVRNLALEWALALQSLGIEGDGFAFSEVDREKAQSMNTFNIGSIKQMVGGIGSNQSITASAGDVNVSKLRDGTKELRSNADSIASSSQEPQKVLELIKILQMESEKISPDQQQVKSTLNALRDVLTNATGNLISSGALSIIHSIFG